MVTGVPLKRYLIQETTESPNRVTFYFRAPREGNYFMTVFAQRVSDRLKVENVFKAACEYKIVADQAAADARYVNDIILIIDYNKSGPDGPPRYLKSIGLFHM